MAKFDGIFNIEGTLKGMTFYKTKDGSMIRTKGSLSKERIAKDPAFERTRENGLEFSHCAKMAKLFRSRVSDKVDLAKDHHTSSRLNRVMHLIKALDTESPRGNRNVAIGITKPDGPKQLNGFDFNASAPVASLFLQLQALDPATGSLEYAEFIPKRHLSFPDSSTDANLQLIAVQVDFAEERYVLTESAVQTIEKQSESVQLELAVPSIPSGPHPVFYLLLVEFYQQMNGGRYPLKNKQYNGLGVIGYLQQ